MKNLIKFLGVIALSAVIGFSMAACDSDSGDGGGGGGGGRGGTLTVTGLSEFAGKYALFLSGMGGANGTGISGGQRGPAASITSVLIPASGTVELETFNRDIGSTGYTGSETLVIGVNHDLAPSVWIFEENWGSGAPYLAVRTFDNIAFSNGSATIAWGDGAVY